MKSKARTPGTGLTRTLEDWARRADADVSIGRSKDEWFVMMNFGEDSPGSGMAAASALGADAHLTTAIEQALSEVRVNPCAECGWEQTCEEGCHS